MEEITQQDSPICEELQRYVDEGKSYETISSLLKQKYPSIDRGLSARSVRRFCSSNKISKKQGPQLDVIVAQSVSEVYLYVFISLRFISSKPP